MDSRMRIGSSSPTVSPTLATIFQTLPVISVFTSTIAILSLLKPTWRRSYDGSLVAAIATTLLWHTPMRSEEHTSELQSLMRISYAVFCLKNKQMNIFFSLFFIIILQYHCIYTSK